MVITMNVLMYALCALLAACTVFLCVKLYFMRRAADEIRWAFKERLSEDTNTLIDISSGDAHMRALAESVNEELRTLRTERRRCQRNESELGEAVTNIVHDLRTPLTAINGYTELLKKEDNSENAERYIAMIENRTGAMKQLTEELFRYSVLASSSASFEDVTLGDALEESLAAAYGMLKSRSITPEINITENRIVRCLDKNSLARVFANILSNAAKYSKGDLSVSLDDLGTVTFTNSAPSLDTVTVGKLFDRFYTVENARNSTGLGLYIARLLTEQMGGTVTASSVDGYLTISLCFPENQST